MRFYLALLPALALAQTPSTQAPEAPAAQTAPAAPAKKAATTAKKAPATAAATGKAAPAAQSQASTAASTPAAAASPKPAVPKPGTATPKPAAASKPAAAPKPAEPAAAAPLVTDDEQAIYAIGLQLSRSISIFNLTPAEIEIVKRALTDAAAGKPAGDISAWGPKIDPLMTRRASMVADREKAAGAEYIAKALAEPGTVKTDSGLIYRELQVGSGDSPKAADTVKVHYRGTLINGTEFDSSYKRNAPAEFPLNGVIKCWTEGVQRMKIGGKSRLVCPADLAYGDRGNPSIPGGSTLIFEVELLGITPAK